VVGAQDDTSNFLTATSLLSSPDVLAGPDHTRTSQVHLGRVRGDVALASANFHTAITGDASGDGSFTINGVTVNYNVNDDSLNDVISRINANVTDVVASYDAITDRVLLTSRTTGSLALSRAAGTGNFLDVVGLLDSGTYAQASQTVGENAAVVIEGFNGGNPIYSTSNDLTSAIPGVTLHLKEENTSPVTVTVARDQNAFKNALKTFVERYNQVVEELHARLTEEQVENPTTELEERYGLLRGNQVVSRTRLDLVSKAIDRVTGLPGDLDQLTDLGITISSSDYLVGRLTLDEATLDEAMEDNLEGVYDVLFNDADNDNEVDTGETGMAVRLQDLLDDLLSTTQQLYGGASFSEGLLPRQGEQLQREIDRLDDRIDTLNDRLEVRATLLRQQFVAAEQAIAQLQGQSYGLVGFLGQG
jgi:flagellar hook-associated protein 2